VADVAEPAPAVGEVKIHVRAASLNPIDWKIRAGHLRLVPMFRMPPRGIGCDFAGEIVGVGGGAISHHLGERVFGLLLPFPPRDGALAEYVVAAANRIASIPDNVSDEGDDARLMPEHRAPGRKPLAKGGAVRLLAPGHGNPRV